MVKLGTVEDQELKQLNSKAQSRLQVGNKRQHKTIYNPQPVRWLALSQQDSHLARINAKTKVNSARHSQSLPKLAHAMYTDFFSAVKIKNFMEKKRCFFNIFAQNIDCGYTLKLPQRVPTIYVLGIAKLGYAGLYLFFLFKLQNIDCGYSLEPPWKK